MSFYPKEAQKHALGSIVVTNATSYRMLTDIQHPDRQYFVVWNAALNGPGGYLSSQASEVASRRHVLVPYDGRVRILLEVGELGTKQTLSSAYHVRRGQEMPAMLSLQPMMSGAPLQARIGLQRHSLRELVVTYVRFDMLRVPRFRRAAASSMP